MRELEKRADAGGSTFAMMMERAGTLTAQAMIECWPVQGRRVLVLVGPGNNGGDGLVCARLLSDAGAQIHLYLWKREPGDEDVNWRMCRERGIEFTRAEEDKGLARLRQELERANFVVDAFLGTGMTRPIQGLLKDILGAINLELKRMEEKTSALISPALRVPVSPSLPVPVSPPIVVAVDLPSGLNSDTGALDPAAIPADLTVTFAFPKIGHYAFPGAGAVGELVVADIGIRRDWAAATDPPLDVATPDEIRTRLPARPRESNKGTFGRALLACGSLEFTGAPRLAAAAAGRVGAGLVTLATPRTIYPIVSSSLNEATYLPLPDLDGAWSPLAVKPLVDQAREYEALLVGCGFGRADSTREFVAHLFGVGEKAHGQDPAADPNVSLPSLVIDADALNALAETGEWWKQARFAVPPILTPHPGEMARLVGSTVRAIQEDRVAIARRYAREWNAIVVLKGAFTIIARPDGSATLVPFANSVLATAGTGDVLAGAIVGLLAQYRAASIKSGRTGPEAATQDAFNAALVGAYIHGLAGEIACEEIGPAGVVAGDLVPRLPKAMRRVREVSD